MGKRNYNREEVLKRAVQLLDIPGNPFTAEADGDRLVVRWRWKDAARIGAASVSKEVSEYRYVVVLGDNGTYWGYDTDEESLARIDSGHVALQASGFVGHELRFHKEAAVVHDADGLGVGTFQFSTKLVHDAVRRAMGTMDMKYKEPALTWVHVEGVTKLSFMLVGIIFTIVGVFGSLLFFALCLWQGLLIMLPILLIGAWCLLTGMDVLKVPVFSVKAGLLLVFGFIIIAWIAAFFVAARLSGWT